MKKLLKILLYSFIKGILSAIIAGVIFRKNTSFMDFIFFAIAMTVGMLISDLSYILISKLIKRHIESKHTLS